MVDRSRRISALGLALATASFLSAPPASAGEPAVLTGKVFQADGRTPLTGVVVHLVDPTSEREYGSSPTRADGAFRVDQAPAGAYRVLAETPGGAFLAEHAVTVEPGANRPVALTLSSAAPMHQQAADPAATTQSGGLPTWGKWAIAGGIALAALFVIGEVTDDEDQPASPS
jgi:Carboxypeptidase regulatory-like domain